MGKITECPRCGGAMHPRETMNALSRRRRGVYICSRCGRDEGLRDFVKQPPLQVWHEDQYIDDKRN